MCIRDSFKAVQRIHASTFGFSFRLSLCTVLSLLWVIRHILIQGTHPYDVVKSATKKGGGIHMQRIQCSISLPTTRMDITTSMGSTSSYSALPPLPTCFEENSHCLSTILDVTQYARFCATVLCQQGAASETTR